VLAGLSFSAARGDRVKESGGLAADGATTEPATGSPFSVTRRLPDSIETRWATSIDGVVATSDSTVFVHRRELVVAVFAVSNPLAGSDAAVVIGVDATNGEERWRSLLGSPARDLSVVGVTDGIVVVERLAGSDRSILGIDAAEGRVVWERPPSQLDEHRLLPGVGLVVAVTPDPTAGAVFVDVLSGESVGAVSGTLFSSDGSGRWYVRQGNRVAELDLRTGWSPPTALGRYDLPHTAPIAVIDRRLVVPGQAGLIEIERDDEAAAAELPFVPDVDVLRAQRALIRFDPVANSEFVLTGGGSVFGATLGNIDVDLTWRVFGAVISSSPSDRGILLNVATDSGGVQRVVDGSTGQVITSVEMVPGARDALELLANGVLVKRSTESGFERVGFDLDGDERWVLEGESPIAIGDRLLVTSRADFGSAVLVASGDPL